MAAVEAAPGHQRLGVILVPSHPGALQAVRQRAGRAAAADGVGHGHLLGKGLDRFLRLVRQADDDEAFRRVLLVQRDEVRDGRAAGGAPGGPELEQDDLAAKARKGQRRGVDPVGGVDLGCLWRLGDRRFRGLIGRRLLGRRGRRRLGASSALGVGGAAYEDTAVPPPPSGGAGSLQPITRATSARQPSRPAYRIIFASTSGPCLGVTAQRRGHCRPSRLISLFWRASRRPLWRSRCRGTWRLPCRGTAWPCRSCRR